MYGDMKWYYTIEVLKLIQNGLPRLSERIRLEKKVVKVLFSAMLVLLQVLQLKG